MTEIFLEFISNVEDVVRRRSLSGAEMIFSTRMSGGVVQIIIEDNAGGIEENLLDVIFDPYTTTSFKERKKGLGMSIVKRIIEERFGGSISVENGDEGARFEISLRGV